MLSLLNAYFFNCLPIFFSVLSKVIAQNLKALVPRGNSGVDKARYQLEHKSITFEDICGLQLMAVSCAIGGGGDCTTFLQPVDEASEQFFISSVETAERKKVVKNFLRTVKGFPCTVSDWAPNGEPAWVVPRARYLLWRGGGGGR